VNRELVTMKHFLNRAMKKADVNFEHASISLPKTKSGKRHDVPISDALATLHKRAVGGSSPPFGTQ